MKTSARPIGPGTEGAVLEIAPARFEDERGWFSEVYNKAAWADLGIDDEFVQDNQSVSYAQGTIRGLHYQRAPFAQAKLVRVLAGAVLDVAVDLRTGSPTYGQHASVVLSAEAHNQIYIPVGFAHGFCTLAPDTVVAYKASGFYSKEHEGGVLWCDPDLGIDWPVAPDAAVVSDKDRDLPLLKDVSRCFDYHGATGD